MGTRKRGTEVVHPSSEPPPALRVDEMIEWLKLRCQQIRATESWILYCDSGRRVSHYDCLVEGIDNRFKLPRTNETCTIVQIEGAPRGVPLEAVILQLWLTVESHRHFLCPDRKHCLEDCIIIGHNGDVWDEARLRASIARRAAQYRRAVSLDQYLHHSIRRWILWQIEVENADELDTCGGR